MSSSVRDPYTVLGVSRQASAPELKKAYHKLAKQYHPDNNQGDKKAESKLKEINAAYEFLSDEDKRGRYDRGEIDANGQEKIFVHPGYDGMGRGTRGNPFSRGRSGHEASSQQGSGARFFFDENDFTSEDIISEIFGAGRRSKSSSSQPHQQQQQTSAGRDINYKLTVPFIEATLGGKRSITLAGGKEVSLNIPAGTESGTKLRLKGQGEKQRGGGMGDAYIEITVEPHPFLTRQGQDIYCQIPVSLEEAVLGASIKVPTLSGMVSVKVPKNSNTGSKLRLKGKGVPHKDGTAGDQYITLTLVLPDQPDEELAAFLQKRADKRAAGPFNPRKAKGLE
jgi:DnaJ-class molecular chaperone